MNTVIVGLGNIGSKVARNLTVGGQSVVVADKTLAKAESLAGELGSKATAMPIDQAISKADVIILTI
jgi:8-hydroxy-5-deazaflavin:NADPH oxidoreductase